MAVKESCAVSRNEWWTEGPLGRRSSQMDPLGGRDGKSHIGRVRNKLRNKRRERPGEGHTIRAL